MCQLNVSQLGAALLLLFASRPATFVLTAPIHRFNCSATACYAPSREPPLTGTIASEIGTLVSLTSIELVDNELSGTLPTELGELTHLTQLHVSNNKLRGTLPSELGKLTALDEIQLLRNMLTGSIPSEFGALTALTAMIMARNRKMTGVLPTELGSLTALAETWLSETAVFGTLPSELAALTAHRWLWLYENEISGTIPSTLGSMTLLRDLLIYDNVMTGSIPTELGLSTSMNELNLYSNAFTGVLPTEVGALTSVDLLWMDHNSISGSIPTEMGHLTAATLLYVDSNLWTGTIPSQIGRLTKLYDLFMDTASLSGTIPSELGQLRDLEDLRLFNNRLNGSIPSELGGTTWLYAVDLGSNELTRTIPTELGLLVDVEVMTLTSNSLTGSIPTEMGQLTTKLASLQLNLNALGGSLPTELGLLTNLEKFDVRVNRLLCGYERGYSGRFLPTAVDFLNKSTGLDGPCPLTLMNEPIFKACITTYSSLCNQIHFNANNSMIIGDIPTEIGILTNLDELGIVSDSLTGTLPTEIGYLTALTKLLLDGNQIRGNIPSELAALTELQQVMLADKSLSGTVPTELGDLSASLVGIDLSDNMLNGTLPTEIGALTKLISLDMGKNSFSGNLPSELGKLERLERLKLNDNTFSGDNYMQLDALKQLKVLNVGNNSMAGAIPWWIFKNERIDRTIDPVQETATIKDVLDARSTLRVNPTWWALALALALSFSAGLMVYALILVFLRWWGIDLSDMNWQTSVWSAFIVEFMDVVMDVGSLCVAWTAGDLDFTNDPYNVVKYSLVASSCISTTLLAGMIFVGIINVRAPPSAPALTRESVFGSVAVQRMMRTMVFPMASCVGVAFEDMFQLLVYATVQGSQRSVTVGTTIGVLQSAFFVILKVADLLSHIIIGTVRPVVDEAGKQHARRKSLLSRAVGASMQTLHKIASIRTINKIIGLKKRLSQQKAVDTLVLSERRSPFDTLNANQRAGNNTADGIFQHDSEDGRHSEWFSSPQSSFSYSASQSFRTASFNQRSSSLDDVSDDKLNERKMVNTENESLEETSEALETVMDATGSEFMEETFGALAKAFI